MIPGRRQSILIWALITVATVLLIVITPFILQAAAPSTRDWEELSNISQAYGALSVFFSAAALLGVVASLGYQSRQTAVAIEQAARTSHQHVIEMVLNDPELIPAGEPFPMAVTRQEAKQVILANLWLSNWLASYRLNRITDDALRVVLTEHFKGELPRKHWEASGGQWRQMAIASKARRGVRFVSIVDEVYSRSVARGPGIPPDSYFSTGT